MNSSDSTKRPKQQITFYGHEKLWQIVDEAIANKKTAKGYRGPKSRSQLVEGLLLRWANREGIRIPEDLA